MLKIIPLLLPGLLLLGGCTSDPLKNANVSEVTVTQAAQTPDAYRGKLVRWGGTILGITNREEYSLVEILGKPLASFSEPDDRKTSTGRFMARIPGFVDPAEYREPNRLTVVGALAAVTKGKVGDYSYTYPVVEVQQRKLWAGNYQVPESLYYSPWWYDRYYFGWPHYYWHAPYYRYPYRPPIIRSGPAAEPAPRKPADKS